MPRFRSLGSGITALVAVALLVGGPGEAAVAEPTPAPAPFTGVRSEWHDGFARYDYLLDEATLQIEPFQRPANEGFGIQDPPAGKRRCLVVAPQKPAEGNPWSWQGCYWDHQPQAAGWHCWQLWASSDLGVELVTALLVKARAAAPGGFVVSSSEDDGNTGTEDTERDKPLD